MKREYTVTVEFIEREDGPTLMSVHIDSGTEVVADTDTDRVSKCATSLEKWLGQSIIGDAREQWRFECGDSDRGVTR